MVHISSSLSASQVEAKILPLERAIADLGQVVMFANDNELPLDQAEALILDIIGRMSGDLNLTKDSQSSAAAGHMPMTLMDELKVVESALENFSPDYI